MYSHVSHYYCWDTARDSSFCWDFWILSLSTYCEISDYFSFLQFLQYSLFIVATFQTTFYSMQYFKDLPVSQIFLKYEILSENMNYYTLKSKYFNIFGVKIMYQYTHTNTHIKFVFITVSLHFTFLFEFI